MRRIRYHLLLLLIIAAIGAGAYYSFLPSGNPDALWRFVSQKCVPGQQRQGQPAPCKEVNLAGGYVIFKDLNGPLQYLLMPTEKMTGMESPQLLQAKTPNFFYDAWQERHYLAEKRGAPIPDSALSLAINSVSGRTQNQLHIHISCLRADVRRQLDGEAAALDNAWHPLGEPLMGHPYLAKRITAAELAAQSPFLMLAREVPDAADNMGHYTLAMVPLADGTFALLAGERNWLRGNLASSEEIQDHSCAILH
ncbi:CDP-diacylglycerol diphosphatase [Enterobacteriales bacterium SAP-6]|uniref:CDP-diacylglycerol pyrophosphatase n=1 Tax=Acerihabitans arboris TaxID=2691583 RepID=A0A845SPU9_9GAMM|nr:CDP-diacylglycerol diphosphatase [Acerihabitans arboris]